MEILQAIILGIVEGLTEFLPVSSTGHLIVAEDMIGYKDSAETFAVVVQVGSILAVSWHYRDDLARKIAGLLNGQSKSQRFWLKLAIATLPTAVVGLLVANLFDKYASSLPLIAWTLIIGGIAIWLIEHYARPPENKNKPKLDDITNKQALMVGIYQVISLMPGTSRAAATIMGGLLSGFDRVTATAFSFYLSIPIIILAGAYQLTTNADEISQLSGGATALIVGTITAFFVGLATIRWLLRFVSGHSFKIFAYYRIIAGALILIVMV